MRGRASTQGSSPRRRRRRRSPGVARRVHLRTTRYARKSHPHRARYRHRTDCERRCSRGSGVYLSVERVRAHLTEGACANHLPAQFFSIFFFFFAHLEKDQRVSLRSPCSRGRYIPENGKIQRMWREPFQSEKRAIILGSRDLISHDCWYLSRVILIRNKLIQFD